MLFKSDLSPYFLNNVENSKGSSVSQKVNQSKSAEKLPSTKNQPKKRQSKNVSSKADSKNNPKKIVLDLSSEKEVDSSQPVIKLDSKILYFL